MMARLSGPATILVLSSLLWPCAGAAADPVQPDLKQAAAEIVGACATDPTISYMQALQAGLENYLRSAVDSKSADAAKLDAVFASVQAETAAARSGFKSRWASDTFFAIYFRCIRNQVGLKLTSLGIANQFHDERPIN